MSGRGKGWAVGLVLLLVMVLLPLTVRAWVIGGFEIPAKPGKTGSAAVGSVPGNSGTAAGAGSAFTEPVTGMEFVWIPGGCFQMGSPWGEEDRGSDEGPIHKVYVDGFWMGKYEVTNAEYRRFKPDHDSGSYEGHSFNGDRQPVVEVSWKEATAFAEWLSRQSGRKFRLPTEAEWEYACRAGTTTPFSFGSTISTDQANYDGNYTYGNGRKGVYRQSTAPVGSFAANSFGLYDMHGNVYEWCADWYREGYYKNSPAQNPQGPASGWGRVLRGGALRGYPRYLRSARRHWIPPGFSSDYLGFRLVASER